METEEKQQTIEKPEEDEEGWEDVEIEFWNPEKPGDKVQGVYIGLKEDVGEFGSNVYKIRASNGNILGVFGGVILDDRMAIVPEGYEVKITFEGKKKGEKKSKEYNHYKVQKRKPKETQE